MNDRDIWNELDAMFILPARQAGDIDASQFMQRYGINETNARHRMRALVKSGEWEYVDVKDDTTTQGKRKIIRKIKL